jgi:hypothetical protein
MAQTYQTNVEKLLYNILEHLKRVTQTPAKRLGNGQTDIAAAGTAVQLTSTVTPCKYVMVSTPNGPIFVGDSNVSATNGVAVTTGDAVRIDIDDVSKLYVDGTNNGDDVNYTYFV